jgi:hypothetical protein
MDDGVPIVMASLVRNLVDASLGVIPAEGRRFIRRPESRDPVHNKLVAGTGRTTTATTG